MKDFSNPTMNDHYVMHNKYLLVSITNNRRNLENGMSLADTRGKKDVIVATVEASPPSLKLPLKALVWFPAYAAIPINLDGKVLMIINYDDVLISERVLEEGV